MENTELHQFFAAQMAEDGIKYRIVTLDRIEELFIQFRHTMEDVVTDSGFTQYISYIHNYRIMDKFPWAQSVLVASRYNPCHTVDFHYRGQTIPVILPPGYVHFYTKQAILQKDITANLSPLGYKCERIILPVKLLAVHSGLAKYGRNNISYIPGWGSHHFLGSFVTDMPAETDVWQDLELLSECDSCSACLKHCPTGAIANDRFLVHCEKCLTLFNRNPGDFPEWINPAWINSLVGCIHCQDICPANSTVKDDLVSLQGFDEAETEILLATDKFELLPESLKTRFDQFGFPELHHIILRNLKALFHSR
jgi:epoxyqueuosine reductase